MPFPFVRVTATKAGAATVHGLTDWSFGRPIGNADSESPDGVFARWSLNGAALDARVDRLGFAPLYYGWRNEPDGRTTVAVSPSVHQIIAQGIDPVLDEPAMAAFLRLGFFLDEDTPFQNIRAFPPDGRLAFERAQLRVTGAMRIPVQRDITRDAAIDGFIERSRAAIEKRPPVGDAPGYLLSGGRDSRNIALELHRQGHTNLTAYTFNRIHRCRVSDLDAAALVARHVGSKHVTVSRRATPYSASRHTHVHTALCSDESAWLLDLAAVTERSASCLYDGIGGDTLFAGLRLSPERLRLARDGDADNLTRSFLSASRTADRDRLRLAAPEDRPRYSWNAAFERTRQFVRAIIDAPNPVGMFYFWSRTRRELSPTVWSLFGGVPTVHAPLIDNDLYDFVASIPGELLVDHRMHTDAIARAYPDANDIPYAGGRQSVLRSRRLLSATVTDLTDMLNARRIGPGGFRRAATALSLVARRRTGNRIPNQLLFHLLDVESIRSPRDAASILDRFRRESPALGIARNGAPQRSP